MSLFRRRPLVGRNNAETSAIAAEIIDAPAVTIRADVLRFAATRPEGFTDEELADHFAPRTVNSIRPRRIELKDDGLIFDSGARRENRGGRSCVVWKHAQFSAGPILTPKSKRPPYAAVVAENERLRERIRQLEMQSA